MQITVLVLSLLGMTAIMAAFVFAIRGSSAREENYPLIVSRAYGFRRWWMIGLCVTGIGVAAATLLPFPLSADASGEPRVINAVGGQWYWKLDSTEAIVGESVQFHVSTDDVNHGFAIYDPDDKIVAQTQAMPGYVNKLDITFTDIGKHRILCLEYCGLVHHKMITEFNVIGTQAQ